MRKHFIYFAVLALLAACDKTESLEQEAPQDYDELIIPVLDVRIEDPDFDIYEGFYTHCYVSVLPRDATDTTAVWTSDNPTVASAVSINKHWATITAHAPGKAIITVTIGGKSDSIKVKVLPYYGTRDYIDEYGINHGRGIYLDKTVWAPVNCGYHAEDFKYGKLYQWGRKYGQGYDGELLDGDGNYICKYSDKLLPTFSLGEVSEIGGNHKANANVFFYDDSDWVYPSNPNLWNSGSEDNPVKTKYDPCPEGWRVPTFAELNELCSMFTTYWGINESGQSGYWFEDTDIHTTANPKVFLPAAGYRDYGSAHSAYFRGCYGYYWSSSPNRYTSYDLIFDSGDANMGSEGRADGFSVRCVQE